VSEQNGKAEIPLFVTKRKERDIHIQDDSGQVKEYVIRELTGPERDQWLDLAAGKAKFGPDGKPTGVKDSGGIAADLVHRCLYKKGTNDRVPKELIAQFPSSMELALFEMASEISGIGKDARVAAKND
jgi:hypothetical protein